MTAVGSPDVLQSAETDKPLISSATEILVKLKAAAINPVDTKLRNGSYPVDKLPAILGCDGAGIIESVGEGVKKFKPGDEVFFFHGGFGKLPGNYAQYTVIEEKFLSLKPENINFAEAAALPLVAITAWESLFDRARIESGQTVLVHAGAGGVGLIAIQLAKYAGARVCTTVSSDEKAEIVKKYGADHIINYIKEDFVEATINWTDGKGVDIAMDNVGGDMIPATFPAVKHYGDLVTILQPGADVDWTVARQRNLRFSMEIMLTPQLLGMTDAQHHQTWILDQCRDLVEEGKLSALVSNIYQLNDVVSAHKQIEAGSTIGKIILNID